MHYVAQKQIDPCYVVWHNLFSSPCLTSYIGRSGISRKGEKLPLQNCVSIFSNRFLHRTGPFISLPIFVLDFIALVYDKLKFMTVDSRSLVVHTGKLQPVLLWREKPVLLALPSNLGIPIPASYPVFRTKWREIS